MTPSASELCPMCGAPLAAAAPGACARCPLSSGCGGKVHCCSRCGYTTPALETSILVRLLDRFVLRRSPTA